MPVETRVLMKAGAGAVGLMFAGAALAYIQKRIVEAGSPPMTEGLEAEAAPVLAIVGQTSQEPYVSGNLEAEGLPVLVVEGQVAQPTTLVLGQLQSIGVEIGAATESTLAKVIPIAKAALFNTPLPAAEANWLGFDIRPTNSPSYLRLYVCVDVAGVLRVARTSNWSTVTENLNLGNQLVANAAYMFTIPWRSGDSINIRYSATRGTIKRLVIDEIGGAE